MYKVDINHKQLIKLTEKKFSELGLRERFDIQEWIDKTPEILGEELLIIAKELILPTGKRLDLLAIDKNGFLVIVELKRDDSGSEVEWQAIKYTSYCSNFLLEELVEIYAKYLNTNDEDAETKIENFVNVEMNEINTKQRIILVSRNFHSDVISAVLWLLDYNIDIQCVRLQLYVDTNDELLINPEVIIPLPEAKDYIYKKVKKQKEQSRTHKSSFSLEKSNLNNEDLKNKLNETFTRESDLTPRVINFFRILLSHNKQFDREEIKKALYDNGIGNNLGQSGRFLSNISQFLTKESNPHLRQVIEFDSGGTGGETKNNYIIIDKYRELVKETIDELW